MSIIDQKRDELFYLLQGKKAKTLGKELAAMLNSGQVNFYQFGDFIAEFLRADAEFFMEKVNSIFAKASKLPFGDLLELDKYILEKYCLMPNEQILKVVNGVVYEKKLMAMGRIFLTNFRLIVCGHQQTRSAQQTVGRRGGLIEVAIRGAVTSKRKHIRKAINRALSAETTAHNVLEWGYVYPVTNALKLKRAKNAVRYDIIIETEKKPIKLNLQVMPQRVRKEDKLQFKERAQDFLDELYKVLEHYS